MEIAEFFQDSKPAFTLVHVIGVIIGMGAALVSDALFTLYARDRRLSPREVNILNALSRIVWISLIFILASGIALFLSDPSGYLTSAKFLSKMTIVAILIANGYALRVWVQPRLSDPDFLTSEAERRTRRIAFACGAISLISWLSAFALALGKGLTLPYMQTMSLYILLLAIGIGAALHAERRTFKTSSSAHND